MSIRNECSRKLLAGLFLSSLAAYSVSIAPASDHDDTPLLKAFPRHDARITDLFSFTRGENLVLVVCLDPTILTTATTYEFASDLIVKIHIDNHTHVTFDAPDDLVTYGGTITRPTRIRPDITFTITFDQDGQAHLSTRGLPMLPDEQVSFFAGLRDDPFIRGPRIGRNVAALVIELPLKAATRWQNDTILGWATAQVGNVHGPMHEHAGRSLRSQFVENDLLNTRPPSQQAGDLNMTPDVIIYDTRRPAAFPNGRELTDDVVDLVDDPRVTGTDAPFPSENDVPFLAEFPYLAPPHAPPAP